MSDNKNNWSYDAVFYQLYPLGSFGAPYANDGVQEHRLLKIKDWTEHIAALGCNAVYFSPLFESDTHGYNTRDYFRLDARLGTNEDMKEVCGLLHSKGIKVVVDGVFNHVGRGFPYFGDVCEKRESSPYKDWFFIDFSGNSRYNDGLSYQDWEGCSDLVKLNLANPAVTEYLLNAVRFWISEFGIDGIRLDVAYLLGTDFLEKLRSLTDSLSDDLALIGELPYGNYRERVNDRMMHSATNYELYNELAPALNGGDVSRLCRLLYGQYGDGGSVTGLHLFNFADNHDVTRAASAIKDPLMLSIAYTFIFGAPGIPCVYYGSEWGVTGEKSDGDRGLRPAFDKPETNDLTAHIGRLARAHRELKALRYGDLSVPVMTGKQCIIQRDYDGERVFIAVNIGSEPYTAHFNAGFGMAYDYVTEKFHDFGGGSLIEPMSSHIWQCR